MVVTDRQTFLQEAGFSPLKSSLSLSPVQNPRPQESRTVFSGSVSIPSMSKARPEPGRSMSASSGLSASKWPSCPAHPAGPGRPLYAPYFPARPADPMRPPHTLRAVQSGGPGPSLLPVPGKRRGGQVPES